MSDWTIEERIEAILGRPRSITEADLIAFAREVAEEAARVANEFLDDTGCPGATNAIRRRFGLKEQP